VITGLGFKSVKGQVDPKKRLDLEIKVVDKEIGQNAYFVVFAKASRPKELSARYWLLLRKKRNFTIEDGISIKS